MLMEVSGLCVEVWPLTSIQTMTWRNLCRVEFPLVLTKRYPPQLLSVLLAAAWNETEMTITPSALWDHHVTWGAIRKYNTGSFEQFNGHS